MSVYTRKGDQGETSLFTGSRVKKTSLRIMVLGSLDELNANLGVVRSHLSKQLPRNDETNETLQSLQRLLFDIGSEIAGADKTLSPESTQYLERIIDRYEENLPPLKDFILPAGSKAAAACHQARAVCRRFERMLVVLHEKETINENLLSFFNRLSDYLFVTARKINKDEGYEEEPRRVDTHPINTFFQ